MGNKRELFEPGHFYHVYNHGNGDDQIYRSEENYFYFLRKYAQKLDHIVETYAYCLMPNHFHFVVKIKDEDELSEAFQETNPRGFENLAGLGKYLIDELNRYESEITY